MRRSRSMQSDDSCSVMSAGSCNSYQSSHSNYSSNNSLSNSTHSRRSLGISPSPQQHSYCISPSGSTSSLSSFGSSSSHHSRHSNKNHFNYSSPSSNRIPNRITAIFNSSSNNSKAIQKNKLNHLQKSKSFFTIVDHEKKKDDIINNDVRRTNSNNKIRRGARNKKNSLSIWEYWQDHSVSLLSSSSTTNDSSFKKNDSSNTLSSSNSSNARSFSSLTQQKQQFFNHHHQQHQQRYFNHNNSYKSRFSSSNHQANLSSRRSRERRKKYLYVICLFSIFIIVLYKIYVMTVSTSSSKTRIKKKKKSRHHHNHHHINQNQYNMRGSSATFNNNKIDEEEDKLSVIEQAQLEEYKNIIISLDSSSSSSDNEKKLKILIYKNSPVITLSNNKYFPMVGIGVGNVDHRSAIPLIVATQLESLTISSTSDIASDYYKSLAGIALIDLVNSSLLDVNNEALVARAIKYYSKQRYQQVLQIKEMLFHKQQQEQQQAMKEQQDIMMKVETDENDDQVNQSPSNQNNNTTTTTIVSQPSSPFFTKEYKMEIQIILKVAHVHLGYGRTNLAIQESLDVLRTLSPTTTTTSTMTMNTASMTTDPHTQKSSNINNNNNNNEEPENFAMTQESDEATDNLDVNVHMVLHSPRCDGTNINTLTDNNKKRNNNSNNLNQNSNNNNSNDDEYDDLCGEKSIENPTIQKAGPSPSQNSWKESWLALEEAYQNDKVRSIGISNFNLKEVKELLEICNIKPHFYQGSIWLALFNEELVDLLQKHNVLFHAFHVMKGIIHRKEVSPNAYELLHDLNENIIQKQNKESSSQQQQETTINNNSTNTHTSTSSPLQQGQVSTLVLAWLVQRGIAVTPKSSSIDYLALNSPLLVGAYPTLTDIQDLQIEIAVKALMTGEDLHKDYYYMSSNSQQQQQHVYNFVNVFDETVSIYRECISKSPDCGIQQDHIPLIRAVNPEKNAKFVASVSDEILVFVLGEETPIAKIIILDISEFVVEFVMDTEDGEEEYNDDVSDEEEEEEENTIIR